MSCRNKSRAETDISDENRFWDKIDMLGYCWEWKRSLDNDEYGQFWYRGFNHKASRIAFLFSRGYINPDLLVLHTCDNPRCCRPDHLYQGTNLDNMKDRKKREGYQSTPKGEDNITSSFTNEQVKDIKKRLLSGEKVSDISRDLGRPYETIYGIKTGRSWKIITV